MAAAPLYIGVDVGTSGVRAMAVDEAGEVRAQARTSLPPPISGPAGRQEQDPELWWQALAAALPRGSEPIALALDDTSGSLLLTDADGHALHSALLYGDQRATDEAREVAATAPAESAAHGASSALAKLLWLRRHGIGKAAHALHQADWLLGRLGAPWGTSDENNALKLGYDPVSRSWPQWLQELGVPVACLPRAHQPGTPVGQLSARAAAALGLPSGLQLVAGTTDSVAAFLATGANTPGDGVSSLGSTLVLKLLSSRPVFEPALGIYSHRLGKRWLAGGASNSGGAVLRAWFSDEEIARFSLELEPDSPTGLDYYPLQCPGERFPLADPSLAPRLEPRPAERRVFFQAILEGIASIEARGYARLTQAGADPLRSVHSVGGGGANPLWTDIRERRLQVPMLPSAQVEAAYGAALLARGLPA
ncbi:MAG: FGGY-family carbohydrate kinase [Acidihalobacter sp.]|uniref:FGGY-family carbohydrate kinase n=1 Tax=Acidihalobacter sp. TaxID=1872108 RepID=UPI00307DC7B9